MSGNLVGKMIASFSVCLATLRPATSSHFTFGFSVMIAPCSASWNAALSLSLSVFGLLSLRFCDAERPGAPALPGDCPWPWPGPWPWPAGLPGPMLDRDCFIGSASLAAATTMSRSLDDAATEMSEPLRTLWRLVTAFM